jgi:Flp pilus assembly protein TadG
MIETALILAFLGAPLFIGTADIASVIYDSIEVSNAAHTGAVYGMISATFASDTSAIQTATQNEATDFGTNLSVTPTVYWACSSAEGGTQYTTQSAATTACTGSSHPLEFIQVVATAAATPPVHFPLLPSTFNLSSTSVMEVEE